MLKRFGRDFAIYGGADFVFKFVSFIVIPIYTRTLSVSAFGMLALLTVSAGLVASVANLGINNAMHRFYFDLDLPQAKRDAVVVTGLVQLIAVLTLLIGGGLIATWFMRVSIQRDYGVEWLWVALVLSNIVPDQIAQYTLDAVRIHFTPWKFFVIAFVKNAMAVMLGLWFLIRWDMGLTGILLGTLVATSMAVLIGVALIRRDLSTRFDPEVRRAMFTFGYPFVFVSAAYWVFGSMDRWLLAKFGNPVEVGLFSLGLKYAALLTFVIAAFGQAWGPYSMRMMREDPAYRRLYARILSTWLFLLAWIGLGIALFSVELVTLLSPRAYWPAAPVLAIGTAGLVLFGTTQITALGISIARRTMLLTTGAWIAAIANVAFNIVVIPRYGAIGSASATLLSYGVLTGWYCWWSQRLHPIPLEWRRLSCGLALVLATALSPLLFPIAPPNMATVASKLAILAAALGLGVASGIIDRAELMRMVPGRRKANG
jgi:O-antigen/teichoic acid export membrane protein